MNAAMRGRQVSLAVLEEKGEDASPRLKARAMSQKWNEQYPPGTPVIAAHKNPLFKSSTAGLAFVWMGEPVIWIKGIPGAVSLDAINPIHIDDDPEAGATILSYLDEVNAKKESVQEQKVKMGIKTGKKSSGRECPQSLS